jgi:hypothetical protein
VSQDTEGATEAPTHHDTTEPEVTEAVTHVRDRFGVEGLRHLIALASEELRVAEEAISELAEWEEQHEDEPAPGA